MRTFTPVGSYILASKPQQEEITRGGIAIPGQVSNIVTVYACGPEVTNVSKGDKVYVASGAGWTGIDLADKPCILFEARHVMGIVTD